MLVVVAQTVVLVAGLSLCLFAAWGFWAPTKLMRQVAGMMERTWGLYFAVLVRILLGSALILIADQSRFPMAFLAIGCISLGAAVAAMFAGRERLQQFIAWWANRFTPALVRIWLLLALAFGGFLIYGAL
jgi:hypothetical protein